MPLLFSKVAIGEQVALAGRRRMIVCKMKPWLAIPGDKRTAMNAIVVKHPDPVYDRTGTFIRPDAKVSRVKSKQRT
ncbi:MAG: hypothetical protein WC767_03705 [Candidatus Paceibacterota bacterium]|jgi:hypothetical protein